MDHHIGFAFSIEQISFAVFERPDMVLSGLGSTAYPFDYAEERFLQQEARISLTSVLKNILVDKEVNAKSVAFSIDSNLATLKRITYPDNLASRRESQSAGKFLHGGSQRQYQRAGGAERGTGDHHQTGSGSFLQGNCPGS